MRLRLVNLLLAILVSFTTSTAFAQEDDIQKQLSNPIASLTVVPIQTNFDFRIGPARDGWRATTNLQPVIPFKLNDNLTLVVRTIVPIIGQNNVLPRAGSQFGLGDTLQSFFFVPQTVNGFTWGIGPALQYRTGTDPLLTTGQWGAGPTLVALQQTGPWTVGILTNHIWSYAGDAGRSDVSNTFLQPFVAYAASGGWTYTLNTQSTYDWVAGEWSVPILAQVSKLTTLGKQPVSLAAGVRYWAASPDSGPHGFGALVSISFIFK
ncbi:transporter [Bradyrhizobium sp. LHD-71]|uniref:transporter n=1 Tax=Bradyrhizobium sp. LHD-71 TaxID=3072141 RepID=UPI00280F2891|nr:transporter [Bradyrhizobium sp. LHD-71]MDQ8732102.1 transporter [Bradyrhizobium sp. LHD-71]